MPELKDPCSDIHISGFRDSLAKISSKDFMKQES